MRNTKATIITLLFFFSLSAIAQTKENNYVFKAITTEDGLSNNIVYDILKDSNSYMWVATDNGLNRYDGYTSKTFFHKATDSSSVSSSVIRSLIEDSEGNIWVGTRNGLNLYDKKTQKFKQLMNPDNSPFLNRDIMKMSLGNDGRIWINTLNDIGFINPETKAYTSVYYSKASPYMTIGEKKVWVLNGKGALSYIDPNSNTSFTVVEDSALIGEAIYFGKYSKRLWLPNKLKSKLEIDNYRILPKIPHGLSPNYLLEIDTERLLIGTNEGLFEYNYTTQVITKLHLGKSILIQQIRCVYEDDIGGIWVGTLGGLYHYDPFRKIFNHININKDSDDIVMGILVSNSGIYVNALGKGIYFKSNRADVFEKIVLPKNFPSQGLFVWDFEDIPESRFSIWMATNAGLLCYNHIESRFQKISLPIVDNDQDISFSLLNTNHDYIWASSYKSIHKISKQNGELLSSFSLSEFIEHSSIQKIVALGKYLFIATEGEGLISFDTTTEEITKISVSSEPNSENSFKSPIWDLYVDKHQKLWIGTNQGLYNLALEKRVMTPILQDDQIIFSINEDEEGVLWMGSDQGLKTFNPTTKKINYYSTNNGLKNKEFNRKSVIKTNNGVLWFGGVNGITTFNPGKIKKDNPISPRVYITNVAVITSDSTFSLHFKKKQITLPWEYNTIEISYVGLNYTNPSQNSYKYKLDGYDPNWVSTNKPQKARYVKLPIGAYTYKVTAANNDGLWNTKGDRVDIKVVPPIWRTKTAYVLYFLTILGLINLVSRLRNYRIRIKKVEAEKKEIAKKVEEVAVILNNKSKVYLDSLKYIKSDGNYLEFVTTDKTIIDRNKLKDILDQLPPNFVHVHRSYVINKNFIEALNSRSLFLKPNIQIPISRTYKSNITS